jgi:hypothetical protein
MPAVEDPNNAIRRANFLFRDAVMFGKIRAWKEVGWAAQAVTARARG